MSLEPASQDGDEILDGPRRPALWHRLVPLFRPHRRTLLFATVLLAATTAAQLAGPLLLRRAVDVDIASGNAAALLLTVAAYVAAQAAAIAIEYVKRVRLEAMAQAIIRGLRTRLLERVLRQSLTFFDDHPPGRLISRIQSDTDALRQMLATSVVALVELAFLFLATSVVMWHTNASLGLIAAALLPPVLLAAWLMATQVTRRFQAVRRQAAAVAAFLVERIQAVAVLQAYGREAASVRELDQLAAAKYRATRSAEMMDLTIFQSLFLLEVFAVALVLWHGGTQVLEGTLSVGVLVMFIGCLRRLFEPVHRLSEQVQVAVRAVAAAARVFALLDQEPDVVDPAEPQTWNGLERDIEIRSVSFTYRAGGVTALNDVSFRIPKGETWAIVGATGAGKSTIFNLLLRFYDPQAGACLVDGKDLRTLAQRDLRRHMALVLQDVYLFPGDILSNLGLGTAGAGDATPDREQAIRRAARLVGADRFIERLPQGYHSELAERGANLSAGERQLLSLARALGRDPDILLLDEATAAVDPESEARIQEALASLLKGRTALVIAHRLSTIRKADQILVFGGGRIVERGRHEELLARAGAYAALHALQGATGSVAGGCA